MPHAIVQNGSNFEAFLKGSTSSRFIFSNQSWKVFFIVDKSYDLSIDDEKNFRNSRFVGTREQCDRNLINYPNCKII